MITINQEHPWHSELVKVFAPNGTFSRIRGEPVALDIERDNDLAYFAWTEDNNPPSGWRNMLTLDGQQTWRIRFFDGVFILEDEDGEGEVYQTRRGSTYVNIGAESYPLLVADGSHATVAAPLGGRTLGFAERGDYGTTMRLWIAAARSVGAPLRYAWSGITNSLEDHDSITPPWKPKPRNFERD